MIDALLFAVRNAIINAGFGYDKKTCEIMSQGDFGDGQPPPRCGDWFVAVHQTTSNSDMMNALNEYYGFSITLTRRLSGVPLDKAGIATLTSAQARTLAREVGFNAKADQLKTFLHMNWGILQDANALMVDWEPKAVVVNGFCEPAHFLGAENPVPVGGDWFGADPSGQAEGFKVEIRFDGARRLQAIATYV